MTSPSQQNTNDETDSHDAVLDRAYLNGSPAIEEIENKHITSVEDHINSADVSVSGGSDTEASRGDSASATKSTDGDKGHLRSSSTVKKPATFKAVSVNKKFLAASKSAPSNPAAKPSDKTNAASGLSAAPSSSSTLSASRPRLVAKSGAAGSVNKFSSSSNGGQAASGPDASAVWNKNRHTITWTDGTKVTLPAQPEEQAVQAPEPVPVPAVVKDKAQLIEPSKSPAPTETATSLPKSSGLPSGKGMILKPGSVEKPTFVAKPPAPASPAKSPWAKLPPVEKSSPAAAESPFTHPPNHHRLSTRDGLQPSISPPPPAREIAADDFSRSAWREGGAAGNRELYNSQSGRYEPVGDRRGSFRADPHARHPAVMQRPHHDHPEPSAAFQTSRAAQEGSYGRRRGSSNVGNVPYSQRMHDQPPNARRPSFAVSIDGPVSPDSAHPPTGHAAALPHASPAPAQAVPAQPAAPQRSVEEDLEIQKKVMRERLELARQRRRDEEAREEAEKQKRIKARLDAMGPAPERKSAKEASKEEGAHPAHMQQRQGSGGSDPTTHPKESATTSNTSTTTTATTPGTAFSTIDKSAADTSPKAVAEQPTAMKASVPPHLRAAENKSAGDNFVPPQLRDKSNNSSNPSWGSAAPSQPERFSTATWGPPPAPQAAGSVWAPNTRGSAMAPPLLPGGSPASQSRTSRFFPTRDIRLESAGPAEPGRSTSPSPPPPDMLGHPAFDGDALHPHVSLPRPQPVVRLPPSAAASNNGPRSGPQFSWANPAPYRDGAPPPPQGARRPSNEWAHSRPSGGDHSHKSAGQTVWGDKFRDLFSDRKAPSARHPIHTGQSIGEASQDAARGFASAKKRFRDSQRFLTTKPVSESCFEEQEMGSLPLIRMPREMPDAAWHPAPPPERPAPRRFNIIEITSAPQFWIPQDVGQGGPEYHIFLPGMNALKSVPAPALRSRSNPRRGSGRGPRASAAPRGGGLKTRDSTSSDVPPPTATRGGRGGYRGRGSDWTRRGTPTHAA
ncbi:conserved hypothetical protein [Verticillium alfalfae VaMs.102]|uniref:Uncharacterized protein n=1 Tax=Verticillium alfalfae (strain VaMs.102 / ATCC MYA-4576 / FGSC 10136) TaxID=526221 RepID=C9STR7_VERA1|nr:conserved hypothetical protein [Verticillium alfalfae VaMs.102]EEY22228.1 conserved hypothetical protein [Verticillium alfalfae VaMs.102]